MKDLRISQRTEWARKYRSPIYFFIAVGFWNLVGAGIFGFMINPPSALSEGRRAQPGPAWMSGRMTFWSGGIPDTRRIRRLQSKSWAIVVRLVFRLHRNGESPNPGVEQSGTHHRQGNEERTRKMKMLFATLLSVAVVGALSASSGMGQTSCPPEAASA